MKTEMKSGTSENRVDWALIGAECRRLGQSKSAIPTASIVFSSAVITGNDASFFKSRDYVTMLQLASIVVRRFCQDPEKDLRSLLALMQWTEEPHIGQVVFCRAVLSNPGVVVDQQNASFLHKRFPEVYRDYVMSRLHSAPQSLCPNPQPLEPCQLATIRYFKESGCSDDFLRLVLQGQYAQAVRFFKEASRDPSLFASLVSFLSGSPEFLKTLCMLCPNRASLKHLLAGLIRANSCEFFEVFFSAFDTLSQDVVNCVAYIMGKYCDEFTLKDRMPDHVIRKLLKFAIDRGLYSWVVKLLNECEDVVRAPLIAFGMENQDAFCSLCEKCNNSALDAVMAELFMTKPPSEWSLPVIGFCLSKPGISEWIMERRPGSVIDLLRTRPETAKLLGTVLGSRHQPTTAGGADVPRFHPRLQEELSSVDPVASLKILRGKARYRVAQSCLSAVIEDPLHPFPPLELFLILDEGDRKFDWRQFFRHSFDAVIDNEQWATPISNVQSMLSAFILTLQEMIPDTESGQHADALVAYGVRLLLRFVDNHEKQLASSYQHFISFALFMLNDNLRPEFTIPYLPLVHQLKLFRCFCQQCLKASEPDRSCFFQLLVQFSSNDKLLQTATSATRTAIFERVICHCMTEQVIHGGMDFACLTRFIFEFCEDPRHSASFTAGMQRKFLDMTCAHCGPVSDVLSSLPVIRARWVQYMINVPDVELAPALGSPLLSLLANMMLLALGEPEVHDFSQDLRFLNLFVEYVDRMRASGASSDLTITRGFVKALVATASLKNEASEIAQHILDMCHELYLNEMARAMISGGANQ